MVRLLSGMSLILVLTLSGCSSEGSTNVLDNADQEKIDAYNKQAEEDAKALGGYDGPE